MTIHNIQKVLLEGQVVTSSFVHGTQRHFCQQKPIGMMSDREAQARALYLEKHDMPIEAELFLEKYLKAKGA